MATRKKTTATSKSKKPVAAAATEMNGPPDEDASDSFARRVLEEINLVRANPVSIVPDLRKQMNYVDDDCILSVPNRDPIQLEEGQSAYVEAIE